MQLLGQTSRAGGTGEIGVEVLRLSVIPTLPRAVKSILRGQCKWLVWAGTCFWSYVKHGHRKVVVLIGMISSSIPHQLAGRIQKP
jgi:hypothetical protein